MKQKRNLLVPVLVAPALWAFTSTGADLGFHPAAGTTLTKTFTQESNLSLEDMSMTNNGQEIDPSMLGDMEMTMKTTQSVSFVDEYVEVGSERATKLKRTFDSLASTTSTSAVNPMIGEQSMDIKSESELEGRSVLFTWNADGDRYDMRFADDGEENAELLEDLNADLDFIAFLPSGAVEAGAQWDVPASAMQALLAPSGSLKLEPVDTGEDAGMMGGGSGPSPEEILKNLQGSVHAEFGGMREGDGPALAVIKLTFDLTANGDVTDVVRDAMKDADLQGMQMEIDSFDMEFAFEGEGQLLWNVAAGYVAGVELSGDVKLTIDQAMSIQAQGMDMSMEQTMDFSGSQTIKLSTGE